MLRPKKRFGQHFLADKSIVRQIILRAGLNECDPVLEIGPGRGELTIPISRVVQRLIAVEKDHDLIGVLEEKLARSGIRNVSIINQDILRFDFDSLPDFVDQGLTVIGNIPYNITGPLLQRLMDHRQIINRAVLMFQEELARRLTACPGNKSYGALTVLINYYAKTRILVRADRRAFFPRPQVDSMVVELDFKHPYEKKAMDDSVFRKIVKASFAHRRKTLINSLSALYPPVPRDVLNEVLKICGIDPGTRAETLDIEAFLCMASNPKLTKVLCGDT